MQRSDLKASSVHKPVTLAGVPPDRNAPSGWVLPIPKQCLSLEKFNGGQLSGKKGLEQTSTKGQAEAMGQCRELV